MKKILILLIFCLCSAAHIAKAACSDTDMEAKADSFAQAVSKAAAKNPEAVNKLMVDTQALLEKAQSEDSNEAMCKYYDDMTKKMNGI
jgi:hypothetical protein